MIVLRDRPITGHDDLAGNGFELELQVVHLRDLDPEMLLADIRLAPLAVLGQGSRADRTKVLGQALRLIEAAGDSTVPERVKLTLTLATIRLDRPTIQRTLEEERMAQSIGEEILDEVYGKPAREEGLQTGRIGLLTTLLRERFGDRPQVDEAGRRLAELSDAQAVRAVNAAADLDELIREG